MLKFEDMSRAELEKKLIELKDLLEEVEEERHIILSQENLHLSSKLVTKYKNELDGIRADICKVENLLNEKQ